MNSLRADPSRTLTLRRQFESEVRRRFKKVRDTITTALDYSTRWHLKSPLNQTRDIKRWMKQLLGDEVLSPEWTADYIKTAYIRGVTRSYHETKMALARDKNFDAGAKDQFQRGVIRRYGETMTHLDETCNVGLKGIAEDVLAKSVLAVTDITRRREGKGAVRKALKAIFDKAMNTRGGPLVSDQIVGAHAEGQIDGFEDLGVERVGVKAEWLTAGDDRVCPECLSHEGEVWDIEEARGILPFHPRCRCAWRVIRELQRKKR